jgi:hypothetical protein
MRKLVSPEKVNPAPLLIAALPALIIVCLTWMLSSGFGVLMAGAFFMVFIIILLPDCIDPGSSEYLNALSMSYRLSLRDALQASHPLGIVYILENVLRQLSNSAIDFQPVKRNVSTPQGDNTSISYVVGFPDQSRLRNAIILAKEAFDNWEDIGRLGGIAAQIQALDMIKEYIRTEDVWIAGMKPVVGKRRIEQYHYSYTKEDLDADLEKYFATQPESSLNSAPKQPMTQMPAQRPVNSPISQPPPSFDEWITRNPHMKYLDHQEQQSHYLEILNGTTSLSPNGDDQPTPSEPDSDIW